MSILEAKKEYNTILAREKKAEAWMYTVTAEKVEKWLPEYNKIVNSLSKLIKEIETAEGRTLTEKEILDGFSF